MSGYSRLRSCWPVVILVILAVSLYGSVACAQEGIEVSSWDLIDRSADYDGKRVVYQGEIVGEVLDRGKHAWITVNDDRYNDGHLHEFEELKGTNTGMGVYCRAEMLDGVTYLGSYRACGDTLEVVGTFHMSSPEHGGDLMIDAREIRVVRKGHPIEDHPLGYSPLIAIILMPVCLVMGLAWIIRRRGYLKG